MGGVFIIGSGRSGTTFLQRVFDSHPDTLCLHEPDTIARTNNPPPVPALEDYPRLMAPAADYVRRLTRIRGLRAIQKRPTFPKSYRGAFPQSLREGIIFALQGLEAVLGGTVASWRVPDFANTSRAVPVLKSVEALARLPLYARACPDMKFVHIMRHPCGFVSSLLRGHELGKMPPPKIYQAQLALPLAQEHGLTPETLPDFDALTTAAWTWTIFNDFAIRQTQDLANVRQVLYDAVCDDLMIEAHALMDWCGLSRSAQTDDFLSRLLAQSDGSHSYHDTIRHPRSAAHRWRKHMPAADQSRIMEIARLSPAGRAFEAIDHKYQDSPETQEL